MFAVHLFVDRFSSSVFTFTKVDDLLSLKTVTQSLTRSYCTFKDEDSLTLTCKARCLSSVRIFAE